MRSVHAYSPFDDGAYARISFLEQRQTFLEEEYVKQAEFLEELESMINSLEEHLVKKSNLTAYNHLNSSKPEKQNSNLSNQKSINQDSRLLHLNGERVLQSRIRYRNREDGDEEEEFQQRG